MLLIGVSGKAGSGKDYLTTRYIIPFIKGVMGESVLTWSFADQLKVNVMAQYNVEYNKLYVSKDENTRRLLQIEGTEKGRNVHGSDVWVKYFSGWVDVLTNRGIDNIVVSDVRFQNEVDYIRKHNGLLIRVVAPNRHMLRLLQECDGDMTHYDLLRKHPSECDLDSLPDSNFDIVIKNDLDDPVMSPEYFNNLLNKALHR